MIPRLEFNKALRALDALATEQTHPCLNTLRAETQQCIEQVSAARARLLERADAAIDRADQLMAACQYDEAVMQLESIPATLRDEPARVLLATAQGKRAEVAALSDRLRRKDAPLHERLNCIDRLLQLRPNDKRIRKWAEQIRDYTLKTALRQAKQQDYSIACKLVAQVPEEVANADFVTVRRRIEELDYLASEMERAAEANDALVHAVQRLLKLDPSNKVAETCLKEITARRRAHGGVAPWTASPPETLLDAPIDPAGIPRDVEFVSADARRAFGAHPSRFHAAYGLALQGLGQAHIALDLSRQKRPNVMALLGRPLRSRRATGAWGLAVGTLGVAVLKMVAGDAARPAIEQCRFVPHHHPLTSPKVGPRCSELLLHTLRQIAADHELGAGEPVVAQIPTDKILVRFLQFPNVSDKKLATLLEFETRHQIPFPLEQVSCDSHIFDAPEVTDGQGRRHVLLIAATNEEIERQRALYANADIELEALQCGAVALHNWLHDQHFAQASLASGIPADSAIAALDFGQHSTTVVLTAREGLWFSNVHLSGHDCVTALAKELRLTYDDAFELMHNPAKARWMGKLHKQKYEFFAKLAHQYKLVLRGRKGKLVATQCARVLVTGDAGRTPGLVRFLRFGD